MSDLANQSAGYPASVADQSRDGAATGIPDSPHSNASARPEGCNLSIQAPLQSCIGADCSIRRRAGRHVWTNPPCNGRGPKEASEV